MSLLARRVLYTAGRQIQMRPMNQATLFRQSQRMFARQGYLEDQEACC